MQALALSLSLSLSRSLSYTRTRIQNGNVPFLEFLLERGEDVDVADRFGRSPLHYAVAAGQDDTVELLLNKGANIHALTNRDETPLHLAARYDQAHLIPYLLFKVGCVCEPRVALLHPSPLMSPLSSSLWRRTRGHRTFTWTACV